MSAPSDSSEDRDELRSKIIGFGERSYQKSYYPELQKRLTELERFRSLLDQSSDAIFVTLVPSGRLIEINETACRQSGYSRAELESIHISDLILSAAAEEIDAIAHFPQVGEEKGRTITTEIRCKDGRFVPVEITARQVSFGNSLYAVFVIRDISERKRMIQDLEQKNRELEEAYDATLQGLSRALSLRDEDTEEHTRRVRDITIRLARRMGIDESQMIHLSRGALLHDIGKIFVPDDILKKPGPLSEAEWAIMRRHPKNAYDMLWPIGYLRPAIDIPLYHHERWDGKGYPKGLQGEEIPLAARLFAVVDVWDALRTDRPYRDAMSREQALLYFIEQRGKHFDPHCVDQFLELEPSLQPDYEPKPVQ